MVYRKLFILSAVSTLLWKGKKTLFITSVDISAGLHPGLNLGTVTDRSPLYILFGHCIDLTASWVSHSVRTERSWASDARKTFKGLLRTLGSVKHASELSTQRLSNKPLKPSRSRVDMVDSSATGPCHSANTNE
jgi:hypothetical protein